MLGILRVMKVLGMISAPDVTRGRVPPALSLSSTWLRAPEGGILRSACNIGDRVSKGKTIGEISDPLGESSVEVVPEDDGIVVGRTNLPVVNRGDALFHVARMKDPDTSRARVAHIGSELAQAPMFDEDEII